MNRTQSGREALSSWLHAQPDSFYASSQVLRRLHEQGWSPQELAARLPALSDFGRVVAGELDAQVAENNQSQNLPRLGGWDGIGRRSQPVQHHPSWQKAGQIIYGSGIMAAYGEAPQPHRHILSLFYLSCHVGEGGHNCPLACTAGAIRALTALGTEDQKTRYLLPLLNKDFRENATGAQFLTELQGGSDVGANTTRAIRAEDGSWRIHGEKWFCSNVDADVALITARFEGGPEGTRGLGLFLLPAKKPDGSWNDYRVRRLKDKLGTRSMASGEIDFEGAYAEALGPVEEGFLNMMRLVINTSRLYNAVGCSAHIQRAYLVANSYAQWREAFGQPIANFPMVKESLAFLKTDADACIAGSWLLAGLQEELEAGNATPESQAFYRVALNINKVQTAKVSHEAINRAIQVLGGNGAIESFSILPRLLRDNVVYENWEGTHNVLLLQVLKDCKKMALHEGFFSFLETRLGAKSVDPVRQNFAWLLKQSSAIATLNLHPICGQMATLVQLAGLAQLDSPEGLAAMRLLGRRYLSNRLVRDEAYLALLEECLENNSG
jgi:alkylation response protein AidB-like acyl-CoA dehydrogenase